jgi:SAM-dependent methyltransferase
LSLRLATPDALQVVTLDVSGRVNEHIRLLGARPASRPYDLQLTRRRDVPWTPAAGRYFAAFGAQIGADVPPLQAPATVAALEGRAVRVSPDLLSRVAALAFDIVHQRLPQPEGDRFDLVVATNVLLYYDGFEQGLAAASIAALLRPGGLLMTNTLLDGAPGLTMRRSGESPVRFSERAGDGEVVYRYQR